MPTDYDKLYREQRHVLGEPTADFVAFFAAYPAARADVLDLGCGQGRDALFIARQGHHVVGVDISPAGIEQLLEDARAEGLPIEGVVADLAVYEPAADFDVIVIDRTLHMLDAEVRLQVLARVSGRVRPAGFVLIADEKRNLPAMQAFFERAAGHWQVVKQGRGLLFVQRIAV